ncbi:hypothetical protein HK103_003279, partial [Boothiomyces macroporosus]
MLLVAVVGLWTTRDESDDDENISKEQGCSVISMLFYNWLTPLVKLGGKKPLEVNDLWEMPDSDVSEKVLEEYQQLNRVSIMNEILQGIRIIKYFAWENYFAKKVEEARAKELMSIVALWASNIGIHSIATGSGTLVAFTTFAVYTFIAGKTLDTATAFTTVNLLNTTTDVLTGLTYRVMDIYRAKVSLGRIQGFLQEPELDKYDKAKLEDAFSDNGTESDFTFGFREAELVYHGGISETSQSNFTLRKLNAEFPMEALTVICGPTGSGKSSLLLALLGEMKLISGQVASPFFDNPGRNGKTAQVAYSAQTAWILNATIRENITFGHEYDPVRYEKVVSKVLSVLIVLVSSFYLKCTNVERSLFALFLSLVLNVSALGWLITDRIPLKPLSALCLWEQVLVSQLLISMLLVAVVGLWTTRDESDDDENISKEQGCSVISMLFYNWLTPLVKLGGKKPLEVNDLWEMPDSDVSEKVLEEYQQLNRVSIMNEILQGIRIIKYFAWENYFAKKVEEARAKELMSIVALWASNIGIHSIATGSGTLVAFTTFAVYTFIAGKTLDTATAFTTVNLLNTTTDVLTGLTYRVMDIYRAKVSLGRIQGFLQEPELDKYDKAKLEDAFSDNGTESDFTFGFREAELVYHGGISETSQSNFTLRKLNAEFPMEALTVICGPTGSGKSSLLLALLGEMKLISGQVASPFFDNPGRNGKTAQVAYSAQTAWILNATIRENITFGHEYDPVRYEKVVRACALAKDFENLDGGDLTEIGEKGINLSGGQKQRISLARACYSPASIVLLDDPLSAVDAPTARYLLHKCILGVLKGRTVVLVSHATHLVVPFADYI